MARTIIVGDVHGCAEELERLLERVRYGAGDRVVFVGDLVARGPFSLRALDIARAVDATIVRGNHEQKILEWRARKNAHLRGVGPRPERPSRLHVQLARTLSAADWALLAATPLYLDLPEHGARVVHAGVVPGRPFDDHDARTLTRIRYVTRRGEAKEKSNGEKHALWGSLYEGPPHLVFGHNAMPAPQLHAWATGLDTACVYGGRLTALVLDAGEAVPRGQAAARALVSVDAARPYFTIPKRIGEREPAPAPPARSPGEPGSDAPPSWREGAA